MHTIDYSLEELSKITAEFASTYKDYSIFCLEGEMGAGKTTFIHTLCKEWTVIDNVSSPTYSIINKYLCANGSYVYHLDLFRLKNTQELIDIGFEDLLEDKAKIVIEWPSLSYPLLIGERIVKLQFEKKTENNRKIIIFT